MNETKHTLGPLTARGSQVTAFDNQTTVAMAWPVGSPDEERGNARLLAAAYTSYDKHCGERAVECAEVDLLGELLIVCKDLASRVEYPGPHVAARDEARRVIAKATGEKS